MTSGDSLDNPLVSIIVPTYQSEAFIESCLRSIKEQDYSNIELIVIDNFSKDKTFEISKRLSDLVFLKGPERSEQRNYGVSKSSGQYVFIIDSDMELTKGVVSACVKVITEQSRVRALIVPEESFGDNFWAKCKALEKSFYVGVDWMEGARFFEKDLYVEMGGYHSELVGGEDYDLPQRIEAKYGKGVIARISKFIRHNEASLDLIGSCRKKYYYSKRLDLYKANSEKNKENFELQSSLVARYRLYFSKPKELFKNPFVGAGMLFMKTCEFGAGGLGYLSSKLTPNRFRLG